MPVLKLIKISNQLCVFLFLILLQNLTYSAKLPHQGRVLISGLPFDGDGNFGFAIVSDSGAIIWNHEGDSGKEPTNLLPVSVVQGFYSIELGDSEIEGMAEIPDQFFELNQGASLRIWFDNGLNGREQLGQDQPLLVAPYAMSSLRPPSYIHLENLAADLEAVSALTGESVPDLIQKLSLIAQNSETGGIIVHEMLSTPILADLNRTIEKSMLSDEIQADLNRTITLTMLDQPILDELNRTITLTMLDQPILDELNRTITLTMLDQPILDELNRTITLTMLDQPILDELNRTITLTMLDQPILDELNRTITLTMLDQPILDELNRTITLTMLDQPILDELNRTIVEDMLI